MWSILRPSCRHVQGYTIRRAHGHRHYSLLNGCVRISDEVKQALVENRAIVALESTIFTHGYPYPENVALASRLESLVRSLDAVPATIGILDGIAHVGFEGRDLERLAGCAGQKEPLKVSRRDLAFACGVGSPGRRRNGGTTVAGTMILAHLAGIKVFATGGLGGVHRGAENSMDISADLTELGRTPVAVVASGCKQFLDIPRTLEYLETQGVPVATFADGRSESVEFPAFWSRDSGCLSPMTIFNERDAAAMIHAQAVLGLQNGMLLANPIPEEHSIPREDIDLAINTALAEATKQGITGNATTPYILAQIRVLTEGRSVTANTHLVESNVRRGTRVAKALAALQQRDFRDAREHSQRSTPVHVVDLKPSKSQGGHTMAGPALVNYMPDGRSKGTTETRSEGATVGDAISVNVPRPGTPGPQASIFVAGALALDLTCTYRPDVGTTAPVPAFKTSNPASIMQSLGGVAHNVARAAQLAGADVRLCSVIGDDFAGKAALTALKLEGIDASSIAMIAGAQTAQYVSVNDAGGEMVIAMSDMSIMHGRRREDSEPDLLPEELERLLLPALQAETPKIVVVDTNWQPAMITRWLKASKNVSAFTVIEPVSNEKAQRLFRTSDEPLGTYPEHSIDLMSPNASELRAMHDAAKQSGMLEHNEWWRVIDSLGIPSGGIRNRLAMVTSKELVAEGIPQQSIQLLPFMPRIVTKLGSRGVLLTQLLAAEDPRLTDPKCAGDIISRCPDGPEHDLGIGGLYMRLFPAAQDLEPGQIRSVVGAGDTFLGVMVACLAKLGSATRLETLIDSAQKAAIMTLRSDFAVSPEIQRLRLPSP